MARRRWRTRRRHDVAELNITAFMNLMVILVPFLLITAVFSRLTILELDLPSSEPAEVEPDAPTFALEITVRDAAIEVGERRGGLLRRFEAGEDGHDLSALGEYLLEVKRSFPEELDATLLLEPDISYELIVAVMDRTRAAERFDEPLGRAVSVELFPQIAIGDAVILAAD